MLGKVLVSRNENLVVGKNLITINTILFSKGAYVLKVDGKSNKFIKE